MAWHYARYVDHVAAAGKRAWPVPMFVNAWLDSDIDANPMAGGTMPGEYPSGGPVPRMLGIWTAAAPHMDFATPDIYAGDVADRARPYAEAGGVQFIPEMRRDRPGQLFRAASHPGSIGMAPFGIDSAPDHELDALRRSYAQLEALVPRLTASERPDRVAFHLDDDHPMQTFDLGGWRFDVERDFDPQGEGNLPDGYGLLIADSAGFVLAGSSVVLHPWTEDHRNPGWVLECRELAPATADGGDLVDVRILNGDETGGGRLIRITRENPPGFGPVPISASTAGILAFTLYAAD